MTGTVYIVDDDPALRDALAGLLDMAGLETVVYDSGPAFLAACSDQSTGCVLLDVAMPGMDGKEVHAALKERGISMPVIFLTGHGDISMAVKAMHDGALDFLEKPIKSAELVERVRRALKFDEENRQKMRYIRDVQQRYDRLTPREREIMALVVCGLSNKDIARELALSPRTVEVHRTHVMNKMVAANLVDLIKMNAHCQS